MKKKRYKYYPICLKRQYGYPIMYSKGMTIQFGDVYYEACKIYEPTEDYVSFRAKRIIRFYKNGKRKYEVIR